MYRLFLPLIMLVYLLGACNIAGVEQDNSKEIQLEIEAEQQEIADTIKQNTLTDEVKSDSVILEKDLAGGLKIKWLKKGEGRKISKNDLVRISYQNCLEDGTVYDANAMIKKASIPFMVGWNLQTPGWDLALVELSEGDEVEIFIPAALARGEKGIPGLVPPNANNILKLNVKEIITPTKVVDDIRIWVVEQRKKPGDTIKYGDKVNLHYWVSSQSKPRYDNSYQRGAPFELVMGDGNIVPGLYKALHFLREGDKAMIHIPAKEAYGKEGLKNLVPPNEDLFYDIMVVNN